MRGDTHVRFGSAARGDGTTATSSPRPEPTAQGQYEQVLGDAHPDTLQSRNSLADAYRAAGDAGRAVPLLEATVTQYEQVLGDTHPHTLQSRNSLADAYRVAGDLDRAIALYEATLTQREQVLGDVHPDTLASRNSLANAREVAETAQRNP
uniref:Tetratricopeptide repeat protein n=1 Tax=Streptomyces sp. NBC_00003 TaxID=2903608 RepID=A0AAU2UWJ7_9ACTN